MVIDTSALIATLLNEPEAEDFAKGNHPAGLNIGDCCAYALAKYSGEPLLFKGDDFNRTDLKTLPHAKSVSSLKGMVPKPGKTLSLADVAKASALCLR